MSHGSSGSADGHAALVRVLDRLCDRSEPVAVVIGALAHQGLSYVRSLGRRGVPTLLLDNKWVPGSFGGSRHGELAWIPSPKEEPAGCLDQLAFIGSRLRGRGVLMPTGDYDTRLVARHADQLARYFRFIVPELDTVEKIVDKRTQYEAAVRAGIPLPETHYPESQADIERIAARVSYPCILKPYMSGTGPADVEKVVVADSAQALESAFARVTAGGTRFMVQDVIPGRDDALYGYLAFWDAQGRERAWLVKRKLRQFPLHFGNGSLQMTVEAPEVADHSRRLLEALGYRGFVGIEWKRDARDGSMRLMEINPRTVSGNQLAISAGLDFPWMAYRYSINGTLPELPPGGYRRGVKYVHENWDLQAFLALRRSGELSFSEWFRSLVGAEAWVLGAWDDPSPLVAWLFGLARTAADRLQSGPRAS